MEESGIGRVEAVVEEVPNVHLVSSGVVMDAPLPYSGNPTVDSAVEELYVHLSMLVEGVVSTIKVMVCRKWDSKNSFGKYLSTEYILSDCEGNAIQCSARSCIAHRFTYKLPEGGVYSIKNFTMVANKDKYRIHRHDAHTILLEGYTVVKPLTCTTEGFDRFPFQLTQLEDIEMNDSAYLIDVIGCVVSTAKPRMTRAGAELVDCGIVNERGTHVRVTLWAPLSSEIWSRRGGSVSTYVVVFPAMNVKEFRGELYLSSTTATSPLFDDPAIPQIASLLTKLEIASVAELCRKPVVPSVIVGSVYQLLRAGREFKDSRKKATTFQCKVRIVDVRTKDGWFYFSCGLSGCKKRVTRNGSKFMCQTCDKVCEFPRTSYRLQVNVVDSTGSAIVTIFDDVAARLIGKSVAQLLQEIGMISYWLCFFISLLQLLIPHSCINDRFLGLAG